ncbi:hypothetical protein [uncultured Bacteroides sp.]|nr:hypothetical protein [uncultured Bacteroides sp.]
MTSEIIVQPFLKPAAIELCEKIETEIHVGGLSTVLEGTFYRIE